MRTPVRLVGWAQQRIANGYADKFVYRQEYFDRAYLADDSGNATTNEAGILSAYGEFFPTQPGVALLTTQPDADQGGLQGTAVVHVVKLQLDVNHDGVMDLSFGGPDNTSQARPAMMWVNSDWDASGSDVNGGNAPRANDYSDAIIGTARDLEDFARLWIVGLPALPSTNGYSASLSWRNATGNPAIRLFRAYETPNPARMLKP